MVVISIVSVVSVISVANRYGVWALGVVRPVTGGGEGGNFRGDLSFRIPVPWMGRLGCETGWLYNDCVAVFFSVPGVQPADGDGVEFPLRLCQQLVVFRGKVHHA